MKQNQSVIDTCIMPFWNTEIEAHEWLPEPWKSKRHLPPINRQMYSPPTGIAPYGEYLQAARPDEESLPGSSIDLTLQKMDEDGTNLAILMPLTRGTQPDVDISTNLCSATNEWLSAKWLNGDRSQGRFLGTIRVNPSDPVRAVEEIERWADNPRMVQVGVPLDAWHPYGQRNFFPIWEAAAKHNLPVAIHSDGGAPANYKPTMVGYPRKHIDFAAQESTTFLYHAASFVLEGVFERLPNLRVVFNDGGHDFVTTMMWRMDIDFGIARHEVPWLSKTPGDYLNHFRFRTSHFEGPEMENTDWNKLSKAADLLMYGSNYPHWTTTSPAQLPAGLSEEEREKILFRNALELYRPRLTETGLPEINEILGVEQPA